MSASDQRPKKRKVDAGAEIEDESDEAEDDDDENDDGFDVVKEKEKVDKMKRRTGYIVFLTENKAKIMAENPTVAGNDLVKLYSSEVIPFIHFLAFWTILPSQSVQKHL